MEICSLEDLCVTVLMESVCRACAASRRNHETLERVRSGWRVGLGENLGGVSSLNIRRKFMEKVSDVRFLVRMAQFYLENSRSPVQLPQAVNQVLVNLLSVLVLSPDLPSLHLSCKIMSSDLQDLEDELVYDEDSPMVVEESTAEFHLNMGEVVKQLTFLYRNSNTPPALRTLDLQGCYIGRMHGGLQLALTRMLEGTDPSKFSQLTHLTLRDFLEPHGSPTKRLSNRVRLCKAIGVSCHSLGSLNIGNIDLGAAIYIFLRSVTRAFPGIRSEGAPVIISNKTDEKRGNSYVSVEESVQVGEELLQPLCSTLHTLVLSLRDPSGTYSGLTLAPFCLRSLPRLTSLHMDGVDNTVVGGLVAISHYGRRGGGGGTGSKSEPGFTTRIRSADWFNPDPRGSFYQQLGLDPESFHFQQGLELLCSSCPDLRRLTIGKTLLLEYSNPIRSQREPFVCRTLDCLQNLRNLKSLTTQCIPAKYIVPVIQSIGKQLESLNIRLHMQTSGGLNCSFLEQHLQHLEFNIQVTGQPLTRGDYLRQEAWLSGGQEAMARIEPVIQEQRLDAIFVDDY